MHGLAPRALTLHLFCTGTSLTTVPRWVLLFWTRQAQRGTVCTFHLMHATCDVGAVAQEGLALRAQYHQLSAHDEQLCFLQEGVCCAHAGAATLCLPTWCFSFMAVGLRGLAAGSAVVISWMWTPAPCMCHYKQQTRLTMLIA